MEEPIEVLDEEKDNDTAAPPINIDEGIEMMIIINLE